MAFAAGWGNIVVYGPAGNNYGRDYQKLPSWFFMSEKIDSRKRKIKRIFNVREEDK